MNDSLLVRYLGVVFVLASLHRAFLLEQRLHEQNNVLKLPSYANILIILFEFIVGILCLFKLRFYKNALLFLMIFLIVGTIIIFFHNYKSILENYFHIYTYQPTSMSVVVHVTYIVIIAAILLKK
jgi:hypothetical protein